MVLSRVWALVQSSTLTRDFTWRGFLSRLSFPKLLCQSKQMLLICCDIIDTLPHTHTHRDKQTDRHRFENKSPKASDDTWKWSWIYFGLQAFRLLLVLLMDLLFNYIKFSFLGPVAWEHVSYRSKSELVQTVQTTPCGRKAMCCIEAAGFFYVIPPVWCRAFSGLYTSDGIVTRRMLHWGSIILDVSYPTSHPAWAPAREIQLCFTVHGVSVSWRRSLHTLS